MSTTTTVKELTDREFLLFQRFIFDAAGICLAASKKAMVGGRLAKRVSQYQLDSYGEYYDLLKSGTQPGEVQMAVDLLTTNETYFFREAKHFDLLRKLVVTARDAAGGLRGAPFRVWSAASSTGEEPYSIAMVLADLLPEERWDLIASDISMRVLQQARTGHYVVERTKHIPTDYLRRFCLKGIDVQKGSILVERTLRERIQFMQINLNTTLPKLGMFDVIFLRNVMIYFSEDTKRQVVARVLATLKPGGYFLIGHSETLNGISDAVDALAPSIYRKK